MKCGIVSLKEHDAHMGKNMFTWICPHCAIPKLSYTFVHRSDFADNNNHGIFYGLSLMVRASM